MHDDACRLQRVGHPATTGEEMTFTAILSMLLLVFETFKGRGNH